jgi:murein tripeptide amidase MpaA
MARQHPGETPGSFMMDGVMDFILGNSAESEMIRSIFNVVMVPMLNPDGVVHGNYRCNLNGVDLNRNWTFPHRDLHDSVYHIRELVRNASKNGEVSLILDLHGHSKKYMLQFHTGSTPSSTATPPPIPCERVYYP